MVSRARFWVCSEMASSYGQAVERKGIPTAYLLAGSLTESLILAAVVCEECGASM